MYLDAGEGDDDDRGDSDYDRDDDDGGGDEDDDDRNTSRQSPEQSCSIDDVVVTRTADWSKSIVV